MKKLLSTILICCLLLSTFSAFAYSDVNGNNLTKATELLKELGIMYGYEGDVFKPDDLITRAEFAVVTARMINVSEKDEGSQNYYSDIPELHFALGAINNLTRLGILNGDGSGFFRPDDPVTAIEAYKMMLGIAGYGEYVDYVGGYPMGYLSVAMQTDIAIDVAMDKQLTRAEVAELALNTLEAPYMEAIGFRNDMTEYEENEDKTLLVRYRDIYKVKGQVTAVPSTSLIEEKDFIAGRIYIDDVLYYYDAENISDLIGSNVEVYYRQEDVEAKREIVYLTKNINLTKEVTINAKNIVSFDESSYTLKYYNEKEKVVNAKIERGASVIRNNVAANEISKELFMIKNGSLTLKASEGSVYDVVIINDYKNFVVGTVSVSDELAYNYYTPTVPQDLNADNVRIFNSSKTEISVADLKAKDVLSIMHGSNNYSEIYVSNSLLNGVVEEIVYEGATSYIINGTSYEVDEELLTISGATPDVGDNIEFILDIYGKIAYYEVTSGLQFGYVAAANFPAMGDPQLKVFTQTGKMMICDCAQTITIDNTSVKDRETLKGYFKNGEDNIQMLIRFKLNGNGEISYIETAKDATESEGFRIDQPLKNRLWKIAGYFGKDIIIDKANTIIMAIPTDAQSEDDDYRILGTSDLSEIYYPVEAYTTKERVGFAELVLMKTDASTASATGFSYAMVKKISSVLNDEGEAVDCLTVFKGSSEVQMLARSGYDVDSEGISVGDIINPMVNHKNELIDVELVYDCDSGNLPLSDGNMGDEAFHTQDRMLYGYASDLVGNVFKTTVDKTTGVASFKHDISNTVVIVYDKNERKGHEIYQGTIGDITMYTNSPENCSPVVLQLRFGKAQVIYAYK